MGKLGFHIPRTLSSALSFARTNSSFPGEPEAPFHVRDENITDAEARVRRRPGWSRNGGDSLPNRVVRIGRSLISSGTSSASTSRANSTARVAVPMPPLSDGGSDGHADGGVSVPAATAAPGEGVIPGRTIRFRDEQAARGVAKADGKD